VEIIDIQYKRKEEFIMGINLKILNTRNKIIQVMNDSELPITILEYIVNDLYQQIKAQAITQIEKEKMECETKEKGEKI
jgi:hypothetical protein